MRTSRFKAGNQRKPHLAATAVFRDKAQQKQRVHFGSGQTD